VLRYGWFYGPGISLVPDIAALVFDYRGFGESGGEPRQVVAQIPFNGFPRRVEGRSTAAALRLFGAIVWDGSKGRLHLEPFHIPMVGRPGELAVTATHEADRHIQTLTGGNVTTLWKNEVAPRRLLQMMRYRPALDAARLQAPCSCALRSRTGRRRSTAPGRSPRPPVAARYGSTRGRTSTSTPILPSGSGTCRPARLSLPAPSGFAQGGLTGMTGAGRVCGRVLGWLHPWRPWAGREAGGAVAGVDQLHGG